MTRLSRWSTFSPVVAAKKQDRREQILRVAGKVFAAKGYHEAKMDDIASAADVAKGTSMRWSLNCRRRSSPWTPRRTSSRR